MDTFFSAKARQEDIECLLCARLGFSYDVIRQRTGLSKSAIGYRLKKMSVKVGDYRNGRTTLSTKILGLAEMESKSILSEIRKQLSRNGI